MRAQSLELHMEFDLSKYQTEMTPKTVWHFSGITQKIPQCLKIAENVSFYIVSEASYIYILSGQKLTKSAKKWFILASFAVKQCYQTGHFSLDKNWRNAKILGLS